MIDKIRKKILGFIESDKDVPLLAGLSVGFYVILFYYARNFSLANSWSQFFFFIGYFAVLPALVLFAGYELLRVIKLQCWQKHFLFVGAISFFSLFFLQINYTIEHKKIILPGIVILSVLLSLKFGKYYKLLMLLLLFMSVFNLPGVAEIAMIAFRANDSWKKQPDDIEKAVFRHKPNIYYIQPDGYAGFDVLENNKHYRYDNSSYEKFMAENGFTMYDDYRSNYYSTLLSNASVFSMKQHYIQNDIEMYSARQAIISENSVLTTLKNNGYKTSFITQTPYLIINRPALGYDYCNINYNEMPFFGDGFYTMEKDVKADLFSQMKTNATSGNFYFVENFLPGHIPTFEANSEGVTKERDRYLEKLQKANVWLKEIVGHIIKTDPDALIIIAADHGGFVGFDYTHQTFSPVKDASLVNSMFGAQLSIRWNGPKSESYDKKLKTGVNLFRTVFSFLAEDTAYLNNLQDNSSYIWHDTPEYPRSTYKYIDDSGKVVFEKH